MFGISLIAAVIIITADLAAAGRSTRWARRSWCRRCGSCSARSASPSPRPGTCSAAGRPLCLPAPVRRGVRGVFGLVYGVPVWGFADAVGGAGRRDHRADRPASGCRSALTWWSFTFPVGTCVTGTIAPGRAHRLGRVPLGRGRPVPGPGGRLAGGERAHGPRRAGGAPCCGPPRPPRQPLSGTAEIVPMR